MPYKKHQRDRQKGNEAEGIHQQREGQNQRGSQEIQRHHDVSLIDPVCDHAAYGGQKDGRQERAGGHGPVEGGRAGQIQQVKGQGKTDGGIAEQRDDLTQDDQGKIFGKQFLFLILFSYVLLFIPNDGMYML